MSPEHEQSAPEVITDGVGYVLFKAPEVTINGVSYMPVVGARADPHWMPLAAHPGD
jgi:hypothetical protein